MALFAPDSANIIGMRCWPGHGINPTFGSLVSALHLAGGPMERWRQQPASLRKLPNREHHLLLFDANGDGKYQDRDEEFCPDGWVTRGGIRCRKKGVGAAPAAQPNLLSVRVLTSWEEACAGSMSTDAINRYLREGYRIVGTRIQTEMQRGPDGPIACTYTTYSLQPR